MKKKQDNLNTIQDIHSLEELSKYDRIIRKYMKEKLQCEETADDLVNDMYIKMHTVFERDKVINGGYIFLVLKNLHLNHLKAHTNRYDFGNLIEGASIPDIEDDSVETIEEKEELELKYEEIERRVAKLTWYEKKILELESTMSLSELSKKSGIGYSSLISSRDKLRAKLGYLKIKNN